MKKKHFLVFGLLVILCSSCYSYKIYPKEYRKLENNSPRRNVYVENSTLEKELKILASTELYEIVSDSAKADLKIKLYPIKKDLGCGQPIIASMLTIGQLPVQFTDKYFYQFDEIENDIVTERKFELKIAQRIWFWDMFTFNKNFEKKAGKAVLGEYKMIEK